jgi:iron(III) transport system permease protein
MDASAAQLFGESVFGLASLLLIAGGAATLIGTAAAALVALTEFPGRRLFAWALILPFVAPLYVLAYAWGALAGPGGPIPIGIAGFWGLTFVYAMGLYPYVYLAVLAGFASQSRAALDAARSLGASPLRAFLRAGLPLVRPALAAGAALVLMEIAADYGAAAYFGERTLSTGIFHAWYARGEPQLALQLASLLLGAAIVFLVLERRARGGGAFGGGAARGRSGGRIALAPLAGAAAAGFCTLVILLGAVLPLAWLVRLASLRPSAELLDLVSPLVGSLALAGGGAAATLAFSIPIAQAMAARSPSWPSRLAALLANAGYAAPGAVLALGALFVFGALREAGLAAALTGATAIAALMWTYAARFAAVGAQPIEAGLARLTHGLVGAAQTLGAGPWRRLFAVDLPIAAPSLLAGGLILFVEILRELPATLILRPFGLETLAVKTYFYASDERLAQSAAPALLIVLASLGPVLLATRRLEREGER